MHKIRRRSLTNQVNRGAACAFFAAALFAGSSALAASKVWVGGASGSWSSASNWQDLSAPAAGGDPAQIIHFTYAGGSLLTFTNDLTGTYILNQLQLDLNAGIAPTLAGNPLQFGGTAPVLGLNGTSSATVSEGLVLNPASGSVTINGSGSGGVILNGAIGETGGARALVIAASPGSANVQTITLAGANSFTGGVRLQSGNLFANSSSALGTGVLTAQGGSLRLGVVSVGNNISLEQRLLIQAPSGTAFSTLSGIISSANSGAGLDVGLENGTTLYLSNASTYNGSTTLDKTTTVSQSASTAGALELGGGGTAVNSPSFTISSGGLLVADAGGNLNRIGDTAQIILRGGQFTYVSAGTTPAQPQVETVGAISGAGVAIVNVTNTFTVSERIAAASLARVERGTFSFTGSSLGAAFGNKVGNILFATTPAGLTGGGGSGLNTSILPYATATDTTTGLTGFATYSATTGVRKLNEATEYATNFGTTSATTSLLITAGLPNNLPRTVNSISITGGSLTGTGSVTLSSGAVLFNAAGTSTIENDLAFGSQEGFIHAFSPALLTGVLTGSNGLTIGGNSVGSVELTGANTITGPITLNAGQLIFSTAAALGGDSSPIIIGNTNVGFQYKGAAALTMPRAVETHTGMAFLQNQGGDLTPGNISGNGGVRFGGTGRFILVPGSTYLGPTQLSSGTVQFGADSALGSGGAVDFGGGAPVLVGNWTTTRELSLSAATTLDTGGFTATWNGELLGFNRLTKTGLGELNLTKAVAFPGFLTVAGGTVRLSGAGALRITVYTVSTGGELILDNSAVNGVDRFINGTSLALIGGGFRLIGNAGAAASETIGSFIGAGGVVTLDSPGNFGTTLHLANGVSASTPGLLMRAVNLGGAAGAGFSRVICDTNAPASLTLQTKVVVDSSLTGTGEFFALYDGTSDAGGVIGYRPLRASEYTSGSVIQNPANGGAMAPTAHVVAPSDATASGAANTVQSLTLAGGLTLTAGQTLTVTSGAVLARAGAAPTAISGGTLAFGATAGTLYTGGDVTLTSTLTGTGGFTKSGPGLLTFNGTPAYTGGTSITAGTLRASASDPFATQIVDVSFGATLSFAASTARVGGLSNAGDVAAPASLTLGGAGADFNFTGRLLGNVDLVLIDGGNGMAVHRFGGSSPFSGTVTLNGGELSLGSAAPFGSTPIVVNGGALAGLGISVTPALQLQTDLVVVGTSALILAAGSTVSGAYDVVLRGSGGLTLQIPLTQSGQVRTLYGPDYHFVPTSPSPGIITVSGAQGSVLQASTVQLTGGGLKLDYTTAFTGGAGGRLGDAIPIQLSGATLSLVGNSAAAITESVGAISGSGYSGMSITPTAIGATVLLPSSLTRTERGTFLVGATTGVLGTSATTNVGKIKLPSAPALIGGGGTLTATSIVPWAIASVGSAFGLATYDADGFRPLAAGEYVNTLTGAAATANVQLTGTSNTATLTINSLTLTKNIVSPDLTGTGKLTITSGVVLHNVTGTSVATILQNALDFGAAEAQFFLPAAGTPLSVQGVISGSGGLTKSGPGALALPALNTFTGPITVNGGGLSFNSPASLGPDTSTITLNGSDSYLGYSGTGPGTLTRPVRLAGGVGGISTSSNSSLAVSNLLSGPGGLYISGNVTLASGNTYQGPTYVGATLVMPDDSSLGSGTGLFFGSTFYTPTLQILGDWVTSRRIEFQQVSPSGYSIINTNGHNATLNGELAKVSTTGLQKDGSGTLTLTTSSGFSRSVLVNAGTLRLSGAGALASTSYSIGGAGLVLDNTTMAGVNRLDDTSTVAVSSALSLLGNATAAVSETIKTLSVSGVTTLTLTAPGSTSTTLATTSLVKTGALFVRGDQLGGGPAGSFTRFTVATVPGNLTVLASTSSTGSPYGLATYDAGSDAAGVIGYRPLRAAEFTTDPEIRNPANGGATPLTAAMRISGATTVGGSAATVNSLTFAGASTLGLVSGQTLSLQTAGVVAEPGAGVTISGGTLAFPAEGALFHTEGDLTLRSAITAGSFLKSGPGQLFFETPYAGALNVSGGTVHVGPSEPLAKAAITVGAGATLDFDNRAANLSSLNSAGTVLLHGSTLHMAGALTVTGGDLTGTGGLEMRAAATLAAPISNTGPLTVIGNYTATSPRITLQLSGNGTALGASSITAIGQAVVSLENFSTALSRVSTVPVALNGSELTVLGHQQTPVTQNFGDLTATGAVAVSPDAGDFGTIPRQAVTMNFTSLIRNDHATVGFRGGYPYSGTVGPLIGDGKATVTFGSALSAVLVGANTTATNLPILPFASARGGYAGYNFVTYDPVTGIRALKPADYSPSLTAGDNVYISSSPGANNADLTVNSLVLDSYGISGTGTLTVASGAIMSQTSNLVIGKNLAFNANEAVFFTLFSDLTVSSIISGTAGLTKTGGNMLTLSSANTFTGPITVNQGTLSFNNLGNLGPDTSDVVLNDFATLAFSGTSLNFTRGLRLNGYAISTISGSSGAGSLVMTAPITGTSTLQITNKVTLSAVNTFAGNLVVAGTLTFGNDTALGNGNLVTLGGGLVLTAPWMTNRSVQLSSNSTIDTGGFDASFPKLTSTSSFVTFTKNGAGLLTIPDVTGYFGGLTVAAGEVRVDGALAAGSSSLNVSAGAVLSGSLQATRTLSVSGTLAPGDGIGTMASGNLTLQNNSTFAAEIASATSYDQASVTGSVTLTGTVQLTLNLGYQPTALVDTFTLILNDGVDAVSGRFTYAGATLNEGTIFQAGSQAFQISYAGGTGNDVVLTAVPEPAGASFLVLGALTLAARRRRSGGAPGGDKA